MATPAASPLRAYHRAADQSSSVSYMGAVVALLARGDDTEGRFTLMTGEVKRGTEPPPHIHEWEHEFYYVIDGEMEAYCGSDVFHVRAGELVFLPQGIAHVFLCKTPSIRLLVQAQAAGEHAVSSDRFLLQLVTPATGGTMPENAMDDAVTDPNAVMRIAEANGIHFLSPDEVAEALPRYLKTGKN